ncbi:MAG: ribbon-helix-helix protein, CopG family [Thermoanaerobaculia bacterium]
MAQTRRAQITIEPEEYRQLEALANQQGTSVANLVRTAVRERYLTRSTRRREIVQEIFRLQAPIEEDWSTIEEEIARAHADGLP